MAGERINRLVKAGLVSTLLLLPSCTYDASAGSEATIDMVECITPVDSNGKPMSEPITNSSGYILLPEHNQQEILRFDFASIGWVDNNITVTDLASDAVVTRFMNATGLNPKTPDSQPFPDGNGTTVTYNNVQLIIRKEVSPFDEKAYLYYSIQCANSATDQTN